MRAKLLEGFNPWVLIFIATALFQAWRGSWPDFAIFTIASLLLLGQIFGLDKVGFNSQPKFSAWAIATVVMVSAVILYLAPRHSLVTNTTLIAFIPIGIALVMYRDVPIPSPNKIVRRTRALWAWWGLLFALIELSAYVASDLANDFSKYPTISVFLDPVLETPFGRAVFVAGWLLAGVYLFGVRSKK